MSNAIDNARKALAWYDDDSEGGGGIVLGGMSVATALRELLESVAVEYRRVDKRGYETPTWMGETFQETRYVTPWERAWERYEIAEVRK